MNDGVAVWTHWPQMLDWINDIGFADLRQRDEVVDVDKSGTDWAVQLLEIERADRTGGSEMSNARHTGRGVSFVRIDNYRVRSAFDKRLGSELFSEPEGRPYLRGRHCDPVELSKCRDDRRVQCPYAFATGWSIEPRQDVGLLPDSVPTSCIAQHCAQSAILTIDRGVGGETRCSSKLASGQLMIR